MIIPSFDYKLGTHTAYSDGQPGHTKLVHWTLHVDLTLFFHLNQACFHRVVDPRVNFHPKSLNWMILGKYSSKFVIYSTQRSQKKTTNGCIE